jgi:glycosyltransferase involved in cell wall biosynthesis
MLQAWAAGLPVISYFDPDGLNMKLMLGNSPSDMDDMARSITHYLENSELREQTGARAREYVMVNHSPGAVAKRYIEALDA